MKSSSLTSSGTEPEVDRFADSLLRASRALIAVAASSIMKVDESLTLPQFRTLVVLSVRGDLKAGELADELGVHPSSVTRMCDRLVMRRLIERTTPHGNRREVVVRLLPAGRDLVRRVTQLRRRAIQKVLSRVPTDQRGAIVGALDAFSDAAGEMPDSGWVVGWDIPG